MCFSSHAIEYQEGHFLSEAFCNMANGNPCCVGGHNWNSRYNPNPETGFFGGSDSSHKFSFALKSPQTHKPAEQT